MLSIEYRKDIDGLRAVAVIVVLLFHMDFLSNGYLGVDIFFTISGYLITKILYNESLQNELSIRNFYLRRIRRIFPLVLIVGIAALFLGIMFMLPNDLENLSHSVIATNLFSNNILEKITAKNYWAGSNHYDPLMHTWSLGIEEQFYLFYPLLFLFFQKNRTKYLLFAVICISILSFTAYIINTDENENFYFLPYRFFELSLGGIGGIISMKKKVASNIKIAALLILLIILSWPFRIESKLILTAVVIASTALLIPTSNLNKLYITLLSNPVSVFIGKISFSIYMWHQLVLSFFRYTWVERTDEQYAIITIITVICISMISYYLIEQPFRNKMIFTNRQLIYSVSALYVISFGLSFFIVRVGGIIKDVPELNFYLTERWKNHFVKNKLTEKHIDYNKRVFKINKDFTSSTKKKILVFGNSFARDWTNVLLEAKLDSQFEISYIEKPLKNPDFRSRTLKADFIFTTDPNPDSIQILIKTFSIDKSKLWVVGPKRFGIHLGPIYNNKNSLDYFDQKFSLDSITESKNLHYKKKYAPRYIDLISILKNQQGQMPIFTNNGKFISQDCIHLTQEGAFFIAQKINFDKIFSLKRDVELFP